MRARLIFLILIIIVPLLGLLIYHGIEERNEKRLQVLNEAKRLAWNASTLYSKTIAEARQILFTLSQMPQIQQQDPDACSKIFVDLLKQTESYTGFTATKLNGEVFASVPGSAKSVNLADRPWFQRIVQTRAFVIGKYLIGRFSGKPTIILAYPVLDSTGRLMAILSAGLDIERLQQTLLNIELPYGVNLTVIDSNGTIILRFPDPEHFVGKKLLEKSIIKNILTKRSAIEEGVGLDGTHCLFGYATVGSGSEVIYIKVSIPKQIAFADVKRHLVNDLTWLGLLVVLAFLGAWLFGSILILSPVHRLIDLTKSMATGDLTVRTGQSYGMGELGLLSYSFDQMAVSLQHREEKLRDSEQQYRSLFDSVPIGLYRTMPDGQILDANPALLEILGYAEQESLPKLNAVEAYINGEDRERWQAIMQRDGVVTNFEVQMRRRDGTVFWARENARVICDAAHQVLYCDGSLENITTQRKLEAQFVQAQKMEAVGRLAGGVAHDFNNLLTVIIGNVGLLLMGLDAKDPLRENLEEIRAAGERAASLTRQLLAFSRRQPLRLVALNLNEVITDTNKMLKRLIGEDVKVETVLESDLMKVKADQGQMEQVIMNLAVN
ncbi:MAG: PAS domain S-box protein, partial [Proteobacteria bacterium]|nr:PAS domain S-box protein [Pseudomonadota bacterium]